MDTPNTNPATGPAGKTGAENGCGAPPKPFVPLELHACMGLNACQGHDRFGTNSCAGSGSCATTEHICHSLNNCRGQGGCGLFGSAEEQDKPGMNDCAWKGSCATPIQSERFSTQGDNKGKSVWLRARQLFEARLTQEQREFMPAPFPQGPSTKWLNEQGPFDGCGSSGDPAGTFQNGGKAPGVTPGQSFRAGRKEG